MRPRTPRYPFRLTLTFGVKGLRLDAPLLERLTGAKRPIAVKEKEKQK